MPVDFPAILAFMDEELREFDTPEATEIRERAELAELKRLLSGLRPEPDVDRIRRSKAAKALLLTPAEEHLLSVYECECEELKAKSRQLVARPEKEAALSTELRRSIRYFFRPIEFSAWTVVAGIPRPGAARRGSHHLRPWARTTRALVSVSS